MVRVLAAMITSITSLKSGPIAALIAQVMLDGKQVEQRVAQDVTASQVITPVAQEDEDHAGHECRIQRGPACPVPCHCGIGEKTQEQECRDGRVACLAHIALDFLLQSHDGFLSGAYGCTSHAGSCGTTVV